jgi:hypothetical protein
MLKPKAASFPIGTDAYGRTVTLHYQRSYDGKDVWSIKSDPVNQRDDGEGMNGLTIENLRALACAVTP